MSEHVFVCHHIRSATTTTTDALAGLLSRQWNIQEFIKKEEKTGNKAVRCTQQCAAAAAGAFISVGAITLNLTITLESAPLLCHGDILSMSHNNRQWRGVGGDGSSGKQLPIL